MNATPLRPHLLSTSIRLLTAVVLAGCVLVLVMVEVADPAVPPKSAVHELATAAAARM